MQQHIQIITEQLFNQKNIADVSDADIQSVIDKYPYMGIAHWLKAKKTGTANDEDVLKASLYAYNPTWLYFSIHSPFDEPIPKTTTKTVVTEEVKVQPIIEKNVTSVEEKTDLSITPPAIQSEQKEKDEVASNFAKELSKLKIEANKNDDGGLIFEPYHTIDYFASQGIKLQSEDYKDKLGKQLKSFTEWLREMKRIQPTEQAEALEKRNPVTTIDSGKSIAPPEVLTETMAEVWAKQGNKLKAIAIYEKLSLLYPDKNPYFAKKIEQLKDA